jgi:transcriptional regulator with XRE-family HTH domain
MKDRILHFLALENLTPTRFADVIGVQRSGMSHILAGRNKPSFDFIEKMLLAFPNLSAEWLLLGKGEAYKSNAQSIAQEASLFDRQNIEKEVVRNIIEPAKKPQIKAATPDPLPVKAVESITVFYTDKTFSVYKPE